MPLTWRFLMHLSERNQHIVSHRCVEHPEIHRETVTKYSSYGVPVEGSARTFYFVDKPYDATEYASAAEALAALEGAKG